MKRSGYIVSVQFFVDADPNVPASMTKAFETMDTVAATVSSLALMKMSHQFVRRHEVPDAPAVKPLGVKAEFGKAAVEIGAPILTEAMDEQLAKEGFDGPGFLDRRGRP